MADLGIQSFVECGPGKVLTGLNRRIDRSLKSFSTHDLKTLNQSLLSLMSVSV
jgi:[acyl-carrier-protein] S-malonyltransferase